MKILAAVLVLSLGCNDTKIEDLNLKVEKLRQENYTQKFLLCKTFSFLSEGADFIEGEARSQQNFPEPVGFAVPLGSQWEKVMRWAADIRKFRYVRPDFLYDCKDL